MKLVPVLAVCEPTVTAGEAFATVAVVVAGGLSAPRASVTVSVPVWEPLSAYVWLGLTPVPVVPSPKLHPWAMASPSGSEDPLPSKPTAVPSTPVYGPPGAAVGAWLVAGGAS